MVLYKLSFNNICIHQNYKIRKIVSTRYDLNQPEYQEFTHKIDIIKKKYNYEEDYYSYINNEFKLNRPSSEELIRAKTLNYQVPKYKLSTEGLVINEVPPKKEKKELNDKNETIEGSGVNIINNNNEAQIYNEKNSDEILNIKNRQISNIQKSKSIKVVV